MYNFEGYCPIHMAAQFLNFFAFERLSKAASFQQLINAKSLYTPHNTPLIMLARKKKNFEEVNKMAKMLLEVVFAKGIFFDNMQNGADPNIRDDQDYSALTYAISNNNMELVKLLSGIFIII